MSGELHGNAEEARPSLARLAAVVALYADQENAVVLRLLKRRLCCGARDSVQHDGIGIRGDRRTEALFHTSPTVNLPSAIV
jgi:hypothetical protein